MVLPNMQYWVEVVNEYSLKTFSNVLPFACTLNPKGASGNHVNSARVTPDGPAAKAPDTTNGYVSGSTVVYTLIPTASRTNPGTHSSGA